MFIINYRELPRALEELEPDMVVYNAGGYQVFFIVNIESLVSAFTT